MRNRLWSTVDRWGPGVIALAALVAVLWYGRFLEGLYAGLSSRLDERIALEVALRNEAAVWQAYTVKLQTRMIEAGIKDVPPPPQPVTLGRGEGRRRIANHVRR